MQTFKAQLLQVFGLDRDFFVMGKSEIQLQREDERFPFAAIITDTAGHTTLRVGKIQPVRANVVLVR